MEVWNSRWQDQGLGGSRAARAATIDRGFGFHINDHVQNTIVDTLQRSEIDSPFDSYFPMTSTSSSHMHMPAPDINIGHFFEQWSRLAFSYHQLRGLSLTHTHTHTHFNSLIFIV